MWGMEMKKVFSLSRWCHEAKCSCRRGVWLMRWAGLTCSVHNFITYSSGRETSIHENHFSPHPPNGHPAPGNRARSGSLICFCILCLCQWKLIIYIKGKFCSDACSCLSCTQRDVLSDEILMMDQVKKFLFGSCLPGWWTRRVSSEVEGRALLVWGEELSLTWRDSKNISLHACLTLLITEIDCRECSDFSHVS